MACLECRRRRIRCDGGRPKCHHCTRLSKSCEYALCEQRRGPKKRSVKELEERLATVEAHLNAVAHQNGNDEKNSSNSSDLTTNKHPGIGDVSQTYMPWSPPEELDFNSISIDFPLIMPDQEWPNIDNFDAPPPTTEPDLPTSADNVPNLFEIEELHKIFFEEVHPCLPFLCPHKYNSQSLPYPEEEPPLCLKYAIWALAANRNSKYADRATTYHQIARAQLDHDEMQGDGSAIATLAHLQAWLLVITIESEAAIPARAWMSNRRACALSQMLGLHQIDGQESEKFKMLRPPIDSAEIEERRRTFWYLFVCDRWASAGTGKSVYIREDEIHTYLPISEDAFLHHSLETGQTLKDAATDGLKNSASPLAASAVTARILERVMQHLRKAESEMASTDDDNFWLRHQQLDNEITRFLLTMPDCLRPATTQHPLAFFVNMCLHEFIISLFTAASLAAQKSPERADMLLLLQLRARRASEETINIVKAQSYMSIRKMSAFTPSCLYVAASVFVKDVKQSNDIAHAKEALRFVLQTMQLFGRFYRSGQMFLAQLLLVLKQNDIELESLTLDEAPAPASSKMSCDFEFMGPLWSTEALLKDK